MYCNFVRTHSKLCITPAISAGVSEQLWELSDIVAMVEAAEAEPTKHVAYEKKDAT
jgi:hypothetical protein